MKTTHIQLEDQGQDFLSFDLTPDGRIANANAQSWIWNGCKVVNVPLAVGDLVDFGRSRLKYGVINVTLTEKGSCDD